MEKKSIFAYQWHIVEKEENMTLIRIYGLNEKNENIAVVVSDFTPYIYIELPDFISWDDGKAQILVDKIHQMTGDRKPLIKKLMFKKRLYYCSLTKEKKTKLFPYLFCSFSHTDDVKNLLYKIRKPISVIGLGVINVKVHEYNASPILQLTSNRKIPTAGWIEFIGKKVTKDNQTTHCEHEYNVSWKNLNEKKDDSVARPLLMGYDIEANSSIPSCMPNATRPGDKIFQISCVFLRQGDKMENCDKYLLTLGTPDLNMLDDITVLAYETEYDLLLGYTDLIQKKQPNIIIGYNIFNFDIPYMINRSREQLCANEFDMQGMDRYGHAKERIIEWSSSAYKNQSFQFLDAEGRLFVDLLPLVKRDYKLNSYSLKNISTFFLKTITKDPLDHHGIFKCYKLGMKGGIKGAKALSIVGKYCVKDSELVVRLFELLTTWVALCEMSKVTNVPIFALYTQGQQLKVFSQVYRKCTHENRVVEKDGYMTKETDHYTGATVFPPVPGIYDKVIPFDFSSLYPTAIIAYNICWSTLTEDEDIPDHLCHVMEWDDHIGCEHDPKVIRKNELIVLIKAKEAEMKIIRAERDKKINKNRKEYFVDKIAEKKEEIKPWRDEKKIIQKTKNKHIICSHRKYRWLKEPMGVLPEILTHLLDTRAATKKEMKKVGMTIKDIKKMDGFSEDDEKFIQLSTYYDVLNQRQNALKISANSTYGSMGVRRGYLPFMPGAMCTTYKGRLSIELAASSIQKDHQGVLIYGDTDSNYVSFPHLKTAEECWDHAKKVAEQVSKLFPKPMSLAFEEVIYWIFLLIAKKKYMSIACYRDGVLENKISKKGVLLQRRDNCELVRNVYEKISMMVFNRNDYEEVIYCILEELNKLCCKFHLLDRFTITKSVGEVGDLTPRLGEDKNGKQCFKIGDYKVKILSDDKTKRESQLKHKETLDEKEYYLRCLPAQVQLAERMRKRGQLVATGSRIEYVLSMNGGHKADQYIKIESAEYFKRHSRALDIDYYYYMKQLSNPIDQILNIIYNKHPKFVENFVLKQYNFRYKIRNKVLDELNKLFIPKIVIE